MTDPLSISDLAKAFPLVPVGLLKNRTLADGFHTILGGYTGATNDRLKSYLTGFNPATLSPSFWAKSEGPFWQDTGRTTPAVVNNDPVATWDDVSGNSRHAIQATASARPLLKTSLVNSQNALLFDGSNDLLAAPIDATSTQTIFVVAKFVGTLDGSYDNLIYLSTFAQFAATTNGGGSMLFYNGGNQPISPAPTVTNWNVFILTFSSPTSLAMRVNGGAATTIDPTNSFVSAIEMDIGSGGGNFGNWDIGEIIRVSSALSLANHDNVGGYLAAKFGTTWTPAT